MKNSQYINQMNVNISEMVRLTFNEQMPQNNNEIQHIITLSMHFEFLKEMHRTIGDTLNSHMEMIANMSKNREMN